MKELLLVLDKRSPTAKQMKEIKRKVEAIRDEMEDHLNTIRYFEELMRRKKQMFQ